MIIAIVGTSHLTSIEEMKAEKEIRDIIMNRHSGNDHIVTGDANGIDEIVRDITDKMNIDSTRFKSKDKRWKEYKKRNTKIAKFADYVYSITTKTKDEKCYHCNLDHQRTGGCWTLKHAKELGKDGEVVII